MTMHTQTSFHLFYFLFYLSFAAEQRTKPAPTDKYFSVFLNIIIGNDEYTAGTTGSFHVDTEIRIEIE